MDKLISFLTERKERKRWSQPLEPLIDKMMMEHPRRKTDNEHDTASFSNETMEETTGLQHIVENNSEYALYSANEEAPDEPTFKDREDEAVPFHDMDMLPLADIFDQIMNEKGKGNAAPFAPVFNEDPANSVLFNELDTLLDQQVEELKTELYRFVRINKKGSLHHRNHTNLPRRKNIDPSGTVKRITRSGGYFSSFSYLPSPSEATNAVDPQHFVIIGDVSGSMGRYIGVVFYLLSCLREFMKIDSYIFSNQTTYASPHLGNGSFHTQFSKLKNKAKSWEYGTKLGQALHDVLKEGKVNPSSYVLIFTDGGFSLINDDWTDTVSGLLRLKETAGKLVVLSPNEELIQEGDLAAQSLWNVERNPRHGNDLNKPELQKIARYGLLTKYSDIQLLCQSYKDIENVVKQFII